MDMPHIFLLVNFMAHRYYDISTYYLPYSFTTHHIHLPPFYAVALYSITLRGFASLIVFENQDWIKN